MPGVSTENDEGHDDAIGRLDESVQALSDQVDAFKAELGDTKKALKAQADEQRSNTAALGRRTRMLWAAMSVGIVLVVLLIFTSYRSTQAQQETLRRQQDAIQRAIADSNRRWCPVVAPLAPRADDPPPSGTPEQVERSVRIRKAFGELVRDFGCS